MNFTRFLLSLALVLSFALPGQTQVECSVAVENPDYILESQKKDNSRTLHLNEKSREAYEVQANSKGHAVFKKSKTILNSNKGEVFLGVWSLDQKIYAIADESSRQIGDVKHSSFISNKPVLGAWMMYVKNGKITEIVDGSGHYQPTPTHMYLILKQLMKDGHDLSETQLRIDYGLNLLISGLVINAKHFVEIVDQIPASRRDSWLEIRDNNRTALNDFIQLIEHGSQHKLTQILIQLFKIRTEGPKAIKSIQKLGSLLDSKELVDFVAKSLFQLRASQYFEYYPTYLTQDSDAAVTRAKNQIKKELLSSISSNKLKAQLIKSM